MKRKLFSVISVLLCVMVLLSGCGSNSNGNNNNHLENNGAENHDNKIEETKKDSATDKVSVWDGSVATDFGGGNGSFTDPYLIKNAAQLAYLSECCKNGNTFLGESFRLETNINLNGLEWYPIGQHMLGGGDKTNSRAFQGTFDGNNCFVSNFKINVNVVNGSDPDIDVGLFGYVNAAYIKNLIVKNFSYYDNGNWPYVGGLIGRAWGNTYVDNCHVQNGFMSVKAADANVGGLIGSVTGSKEYYVANCSADTSIIVECSIYNDLTYEKEGQSYYYGNLCFLVGGLIGKAEDVLIYNCFSTGDVSGAMVTDANKFDGDFIGGLVGYTSNATVKSCYSTATVKTYDTEDEGYIGGLIGLAGGPVTTSYSAGKIECSSPDFYCGGLVGGTYDPISNCFSMTNIYADGEDMGCHTLIGVVESKKTNVTNCYISSEAVIENDDYYSSPRDLNEETVEPNRFKNKLFVTETIGFTQYDKSKIVEGEYYSGWIISDNSLPKMFYEEQIAPETVDLNKELTSYLGMTAKEITKKLGSDYSLTGGSIYYSSAQVSFTLGNYSGTYLGTEEIVAINVGGERDLGNGLNSSMTFSALKNASKQDIPAPSYLEIDGTYIVSLDVGNFTYVYSWSTENYDTEKCDYVSITKKQ